MRRVCSIALALGLIAILAGQALTQEKGKGKGRGPRFGAGGGMYAMLVQNKGVQKELNLTEDQSKKAADVAKEIRDKHKSEYDELQNLQDYMERFRKMGEVNRVVDQETIKAFDDVLKPEQVTRLKQIELQQRGPRALTDPSVQTALKLTDEQKEKVRTIWQDAMSELAGLRQGGGGFNEETRKKMAEVNKDALKSIQAVFTDEQKKTWKEMTGEPFEVKFDRPPGGGGRKKRDS
jgi:hypothetical protein